MTKCSPPFLHSELRWSSCGAPHPRHRPSRDWADARPNCWPVPPSCVNNFSEGTSHELVGQDPPHRRAQGGGDEARGRPSGWPPWPGRAGPGGATATPCCRATATTLPHTHGYTRILIMINWLIDVNKCLKHKSNDWHAYKKGLFEYYISYSYRQKQTDSLHNLIPLSSKTNVNQARSGKNNTYLNTCVLKKNRPFVC